MVGVCRDEDQLVTRGEALCVERELDALLITRSEHGVTLLRPDQAPLHVPTAAREVFDVTGAGDTVIATLAAALAANVDIARGCLLANAAAGVVVGKPGTATVSQAELRQALSGQHATRSEERRGGEGCDSTGRPRGSPDH